MFQQQLQSYHHFYHYNYLYNDNRNNDNYENKNDNNNNYNDKDKVTGADVTLGKSILVNKDMNDKELTEYLEDVMWTVKWNQMEKAAQNSKDTVPYRFEDKTYYLYSREEETADKWKKHTDKLRAQFKMVNWEEEQKYEIKTKEQKLQEEMETYTLKLKRKQFPFFLI